MPRIGRQKSSTGRYHAIIRGINIQIIFENIEDKEKFLQIDKQTWGQGSCLF